MSLGLFAWPVESEPSWLRRHGRKHVQRLARAALADDDPVGPHVHRVAQQVAGRDLALALEVRRARLEREDMVLAEPELGGVLDRHDPLAVGDERRQDVEGRRLARARAARHEHVEAGLDAGAQEVEHLGRRGAEPDEVVDGVRPRGELADGDDGADERERLDDGVDARAVGEARVDARARLVDAPPERRDDPVDDAQHVLVVQEHAVDALDLATALDVDVRRPVDHDLGHRLVVEERLDRPEALDLVGQLLDESIRSSRVTAAPCCGSPGRRAPRRAGGSRRAAHRGWRRTRGRSASIATRRSRRSTSRGSAPGPTASAAGHRNHGARRRRLAGLGLLGPL